MTRIRWIPFWGGERQSDSEISDKSYSCFSILVWVFLGGGGVRVGGGAGGGCSISFLYQNPTPPGDNFFFGHDPDDLSELFLVNDDHDDHRYFFSLVFILTIPKITVTFFRSCRYRRLVTKTHIFEFSIPIPTTPFTFFVNFFNDTDDPRYFFFCATTPSSFFR